MINLSVKKSKALKILLLGVFILLSTNLFSIEPNNCERKISEFVNFLELENEYSNPLTMEYLINDVFHMSDFKSIYFSFDSIKKKRPIGKIVDQIITGVINKQPAMCQFISSIPDDFFQNISIEEKVNFKTQIRKLIHHTIILEYLVTSMIFEPLLISDVYEFMMNKRKELDIDFFDIYSDFDLFSALKVFTMDRSFRWMIARHNDGIIDEGPVDPLTGCGPYSEALAINIKEANLKELTNGHFRNYRVGQFLARHSYSHSYFKEMENGNRKINFDLGSPEWTSMYISWNFSFLLGNLKYLDILIPKLIIPSVIAVPQEEFLYARVLSLWVSANIYSFAGKLQSPNDFFIPRRRKLNQILEKSTLKYLNSNRDILSRCR